MATKRKNPWDPKQFKKSRVKGNEKTWKNAASGITDSPTYTEDADMKLLGIDTLTNLKTLTQARNKAMLNAHPDKGGTDSQARAILEAFARLKERV